jgi:hypothetical protein
MYYILETKELHLLCKYELYSQFKNLYFQLFLKFNQVFST